MIFEKLQKARVLLQNKNIKKSGKNDYAGFTYFELADFLPAINEIFAELKLYSKFNLTKSMATLKIIDTEDKSSDIFFMPTAELQLKGCNSVQALGGTNTYLRRYLYLNALEIVENDLFDSTTGKTSYPQQKPKTSSKVTDFVNKLKNAKLTNEQMQKFCEMHNISSKDEKTIDEFLNNNNFDNCIIEFLKAS